MKTICLSFCNGKKHDFRMFKESRVHAGKDTEFGTDTGYTGITVIHPNSILPEKRSKNTSLTKEEKSDNCLISKKRIYTEHAIRFVKRFRTLSKQYRNRRKGFALHFSLLVGICNFDMSVQFRKRSNIHGLLYLFLWSNIIQSFLTYFVRY